MLYDPCYESCGSHDLLPHLRKHLPRVHECLPVCESKGSPHELVPDVAHEGAIDLALEGGSVTGLDRQFLRVLKNGCFDGIPDGLVQNFNGRGRHAFWGFRGTVNGLPAWTRELPTMHRLDVHAGDLDGRGVVLEPGQDLGPILDWFSGLLHAA